MASSTRTPGQPVAAVFSPWFGFAAVGALILLVALWRTPYRGMAIGIAAVIALGWVLRYYPIVRSQIATSADSIAGVAPAQKG